MLTKKGSSPSQGLIIRPLTPSSPLRGEGGEGIWKLVIKSLSDERNWKAESSNRRQAHR
jgi:hypothetical protein